MRKLNRSYHGCEIESTPGKPKAFEVERAGKTEVVKEPYRDPNTTLQEPARIVSDGWHHVVRRDGRVIGESDVLGEAIHLARRANMTSAPHEVIEPEPEEPTDLEGED